MWNSGFSLIELVLVMILLGILGAVAIPNFIDLRDDARIAVTRDEMAALKRGITGDSRLASGGTLIFPGYEADVGKLPSTLSDLVAKPAGVNSYDPLSRLGWRGPYVDPSPTSDYAKDAWTSSYIYDSSNRFIRSPGPNKIDDKGSGDDVTLNF